MQPDDATSTQQANATVHIEPRTVAVPGDEFIESIEFSADGETIFASTRVEMLDFRALIRDESGWFALGMIIPMLLAVLLCIRRVRARPRRQGELYCSRCNYEVGPTLQAGGDRCVECGTHFETRKPSIGQSRWIRWAPTGGLIALTLAVAFAAYSPWTKKPVAAWAAAQTGASRWWFEVLRAAGVPMKADWLNTGSRLFAVDAATGKRLHTIMTRHEPPTSFRPMPDGTLLIRRLDRIESVDPESGSVVAVFRPFTDTVIGEWDLGDPVLCDGGDSVLINWWRDSVEDAHLSAWNPLTGSRREVLTVPTFMVTSRTTNGQIENHNNGSHLWPIGDVANSKEFNVLWMERGSCWHLTFETLNSPTGIQWKYKVNPNPISANAAFLADGSVGFESDGYRTIFSFNSRIYEQTGSFKVGDVKTHSARDLKLARNDRWLFFAVDNGFPTTMNHIYVRDLQTGALRVQLNLLTCDRLINEIAVSPSGRRAASIISCSGKMSTPYGGTAAGPSLGISIWDLSPVLDADAMQDASEKSGTTPR